MCGGSECSKVFDGSLYWYKVVVDNERIYWLNNSVCLQISGIIFPESIEMFKSVEIDVEGEFKQCVESILEK